MGRVPSRPSLASGKARYTYAWHHARLQRWTVLACAHHHNLQWTRRDVATDSDSEGVKAKHIATYMHRRQSNTEQKRHHGCIADLWCCSRCSQGRRTTKSIFKPGLHCMTFFDSTHTGRASFNCYEGASIAILSVHNVHVMV